MKTCHLLVVDDDDDLRSSLVEALGQWYLVGGAQDGATALDYLRRCAEQPKAVLLDVNMPSMAGPEVVAVMRQDPRMAATPVVLMSSRQDLRELAEASGVQGWARKPFDFDRLIDLLGRFCAPSTGALHAGRALAC